MNIVKKYVGKGKRKTTIGMEREQTTSEYEKAIQYIDQLIQQGDLQIGSKLPTERAIAEELGILCLFCFWNRYRSCIRSRSHASCNRPMRTGEENF